MGEIEWNGHAEFCVRAEFRFQNRPSALACVSNFTVHVSGPDHIRSLLTMGNLDVLRIFCNSETGSAKKWEHSSMRSLAVFGRQSYSFPLRFAVMCDGGNGDKSHFTPSLQGIIVLAKHGACTKSIIESSLERNDQWMRTTRACYFGHRTRTSSLVCVCVCA